MDYMAIIKEFMRNIVIFAVLSAFCIHLLPGEKYRKYARFAIGLVYICMVLAAVGQLLGITAPNFEF